MNFSETVKIGQPDLMRGEHVVESSASKKRNDGVLMPSHTVGDPSFYAKKRAREAEIGRALTTDEFLTEHYQPSDAPTASGTSIFDPVLCELLYSWFCPPGGVVLDPFAGGSVRGIVASRLGRAYHGVDLSARQIAANREQADAICRPQDPVPTWHVGDSAKMDDLLSDDLAADLIFSCPPYFDLEVYGDHPADLSAMSWDDFRTGYREIITRATARLRDDRFACFVVGDVRDGRGFYRGLPGVTIDAFTDAGLKLYNDAVLVTAVGSLPLRVGKQFRSGRKLGKTHQDVLVFIKGDPRKAAETIGDVDRVDFHAADAEEFGEVL